MTTKPKIPGIHHITAVSSSASENLDFYQKTLGLRLVKKTVNFDDPYTYHLYYGDAEGAPGTILTFFPWEKLPRGKPGAGMVTAVAFAIPKGSLDFWIRRLGDAGREVKTEDRFGEPVIRFTDPNGLPLELVGAEDPPSTVGWKKSPFNTAHALTGFHSATATLNSLEEIRYFLTDGMGLTPQDAQNHRHRFSTDSQTAPGHFFDILVDPSAPAGKSGGGTVHHIAFRTENDANQAAWRHLLLRFGANVTEVRDRTYFRSVYFHSPGGVLFEIATDPPGFGVDESSAELGTGLMLPERYEKIRGDIEHRLPTLRA